MSEIRIPPVEEPIVLHGPMTGDLTDSETRDAPPPLDVIDARPAEATVPVSVAAVAPVATVASERAFGLDALRGLLLLAMNFAFTIPNWGPFAAWMYHAQIPPSQEALYVNQPGFGWRDLLYPGFIFTMSAAIPITMGARLAKGMPYPQITWIAVRRGALLLLFALLIGHVNPYWTHDYAKTGNIAAIFGLLVCFAVFVRPPRDLGARTARVLRYTAWAGVATVLFVIPAWYGQSFSPMRQDGIIGSLAFLTVAGTLIWLFTRVNTMARLAIIPVIVAGRTLAPHVDWIGSVWYWTPAPWLYQPWLLDLLLIAIPGTIVGDQLAHWMKRPAEEPMRWTTARLATLAALGLAVPVVLAVGLYQRRYPMETAAALVAIAAASLMLTRTPASARDYVLMRLWQVAAVCLAIGALIEPLEGGIRKDPQTLGYLALMTGTATAMLAALLVVVDVFKPGRRLLRPLADIGQNPLFAYVVFFLGILHGLWLLNAGNAMTATWQQATLRGLALTTLTGFVVWLTTKKRLLWRA